MGMDPMSNAQQQETVPFRWKLQCLNQGASGELLRVFDFFSKAVSREERDSVLR